MSVCVSVCVSHVGARARHENARDRKGWERVEVEVRAHRYVCGLRNTIFPFIIFLSSCYRKRNST